MKNQDLNTMFCISFGCLVLLNVAVVWIKLQLPFSAVCHNDWHHSLTFIAFIKFSISQCTATVHSGQDCLYKCTVACSVWRVPPQFHRTSCVWTQVLLPAIEVITEYSNDRAKVWNVSVRITSCVVWVWTHNFPSMKQRANHYGVIPCLPFVSCHSTLHVIVIICLNWMM